MAQDSARVEYRTTHAGCFVCKKTKVRVRVDKTLGPHTGQDGEVCPGTGTYCDPHDEPEAWRTKTCGECGSTNYDCGDNGCCDRCRFAHRTEVVARRTRR